MVLAAILRAEQIERSQLRRHHPELHVAARNDVPLDPELRHVKAVQHIRRTHHEYDRRVNGDVDVAVVGNLPVRIRERVIPHVGRDIHLVRIRRRNHHVQISLEPIKENDDDDDRWNKGPGQLQRRAVLGRIEHRLAFAITVFPRKSHQQDQNQQEEKCADPEDEEKEPVDVRRDLRSLRRHPEAPTHVGQNVQHRVHQFVPAVSSRPSPCELCFTIRKIAPPNTINVRIPPTFIRLVAAHEYLPVAGSKHRQISRI